METPANTPIIQTEDLWRTYHPSATQAVHALRGVSLRIESGRFVALKGRSGSGKTTLLNCVGGLDQPSQGQVCVFGRELTGLSERELTLYRRSQVGFVFQAFGLSAVLSAYENVELLPRLAGFPARQRRERVEACLRLVGLEDWMHHRPDELSGGQQQRIAIARALANGPRLLLADEPTGKLDTATAREILSIFRKVAAEEGVTILMASHDPLVDQYVDEIIRLKDGAVEQETFPFREGRAGEG